MWRPEFYWNAGEAGTGTEVGYSGSGKVKTLYHRGHRGHRVNLGEEVAGGKEGFAEVTGDYLFFVADGGEVDAGVPVEE